MIHTPTLDALSEALKAAGSAHHDYESGFLGGERDEAWPGWYAAYVLGRLGDFASATELSEWLRDVSYACLNQPSFRNDCRIPSAQYKLHSRDGP